MGRVRTLPVEMFTIESSRLAFIRGTTALVHGKGP